MWENDGPPTRKAEKNQLSNLVINNLREKQTEKQGYLPEPTPIQLKCSYPPCRKKLRGLTYRCQYCGGKFCEAHRLPEDHGCENPSLPADMRQGYGTKTPSASTHSNAQAETN